MKVVPSRDDGKPEAREIVLDVIRGKTEGLCVSPRLLLTRNGMNATRPAICYQTTIYTSLHRPSDEMKLLKLLCLPKTHRRARSRARSEIGPVEDQTGLAAPRPTESAPDLRIGTSTLPAPSPLTPNDQESTGM